ncbi:hypothetical protein PT974_07342 [Cladobotryum mycophilum]|uniref:Uncharacterized protein n=1 Tax=Cladobotryum mycophilum TaxID=491253 RepID=A0ABR0SPD4_9HYPO
MSPLMLTASSDLSSTKSYQLLLELKKLRQQELSFEPIEPPIRPTSPDQLPGFSNSRSSSISVIKRRRSINQQKIISQSYGLALDLLPASIETRVKMWDAELPEESEDNSSKDELNKELFDNEESKREDPTQQQVQKKASNQLMSLSVSLEKLKEILGDALKDKERDPWPMAGSADNNWSYWKAVVEKDNVSHTYPRHRPDFIPPWQLAQNPQDGSFYHWDDFDFKFSFPNPWLHHRSVKKLVNIDAPYSLVPAGEPGAKVPVSVPRNTFRTAWKMLHSNLGTLFSVPPDGRISLAFESDKLRSLSLDNDKVNQQNVLASYLQSMSELKAKLSEGEGLFQVCDYSDFGSALKEVSYDFEEMSELMNEEWNKAPSYRKAVWPALNHEASGFIVGATSFELEIKDGRVESLRFPNKMVHPWFRIIKCRGIPNLETPFGDADKLLINDKANGQLIESMLDSHRSCRQFVVPSTMIPSTQTTAFNINSGLFYLDQNKCLQQHAFNVLYCPQDKYWTILVIAGKSASWLDKYQPTKFSISILELIDEALENAVHAWHGIHDGLKHWIRMNSLILDPRQHDHSLFDDDTFSRSRQNFWALDSLELFVAQIEDIINQWNDFWAAQEMPLRDLARHERTENELKRRVQFIGDRIKRLEEYKKRFMENLDKVRTHGNSLFNASAVVESRASTRLGENVEILTYVSIFYLPLSFCAALWSINESYSRSYLSLVTILVTIATFIVVANLYNVIKKSSDIFRDYVKEPILRVMENRTTWEDKLKKFRSFRPDRGSVVPSKWHLISFIAANSTAKIVDPIKRRLPTIILGLAWLKLTLFFGPRMLGKKLKPVWLLVTGHREGTAAPTETKDVEKASEES